MKNIKNNLLLLICLLLAVNIVSAQPNAQLQNINCVVIDGHSVIVNDLFLENVNSGNAISYNVSFNLFISQNSEFIDVLKSFLQADEKPGSGNIYINKYARVRVDNDVAKINEQWTYASIIVDEIILPDLDASATRQNAYLKIKFHTKKAKVSHDVSNDISLKTLLSKEVTATKSNFTFNLENLPFRFISKISAFNLCATGSKNFTLTISARDIAAWNDVMINNPAKLFKAGRLAYLHPNFRDELFVINILNVRIVTIRNLPSSAGQLQRYEIVLSFDGQETGKK